MESILIADDHPLTREALASLLGQHGFDVVGHASDGEEAIVEAGRLRPKLVLLDLTMPGMDGLTALPHIREASPESEVVVLTASGTDENLLEAIRAGAAGYLLKSEPPERIALFLRGVAHGEAALSGAVARRLLDRVRAGGRTGGVRAGGAGGAGSPMRWHRRSPPGRSRCCFSWTSISGPTRSPHASTSPSTRCA